MQLGPLHIGAIGLLIAGAAGIYFIKKKSDTHNIAVFRPNDVPANSGYDDIHGFDIRDYPEESPVYRMRTKQPNGIINSTTWWQNSHTAMGGATLVPRETQIPISGYIQFSPMP